MTDLASLLVEMRENDVLAAVRAEADAGASPPEVIDRLLDGMRMIGEKFEAGEYLR